jgi:hypothetical protein
MDPVLAPLCFATDGAGGGDGREHVIFGRGDNGSSDGSCVDLVVDLEASRHRRVSDVHYRGYP